MKIKITNKIRRMVASFGLGFSLADLLPPKPHFTRLDWATSVLAVAIFVMSLFIKEEKTHDVPN